MLIQRCALLNVLAVTRKDKGSNFARSGAMNQIIYLIGLIVVIMLITPYVPRATYQCGSHA
jgi:hypothetical protein